MLSVVIPALNEEQAIKETIESIRGHLDKAGITHEIIVVNDGSSDKTGEIAASAGAVVYSHPQPGGYGRSLKDGIKVAKYDLIAITDADGTYPNDRLPELYNIVATDGYDMAIGARTGSEYRGTFLKMPARRVFLWLSRYATGENVVDINSGLRVFRKEIPLKYWDTISNGFSFTTTITLAAFLNGYFVKYINIEYYKRVGSSHIRYWRDTLRSLQIIVENILYYNPLKMFLLIVNFLIGISLLAFIIMFASDNNKLSTFMAFLSAFSFVGSFIVAAIGMGADLCRMTAKNVSKPPEQK
ncbi:MAG TPA: glycosyltransferase family 2 protein [Candidatus Wallbacteria bacterium]|nr:glycosyltransferase family 2 protein [Candidatus Wallbacteria bacterium]